MARACVPGSAGNEAELSPNSPSRKKRTSPSGVFLLERGPMRWQYGGSPAGDTANTAGGIIALMGCPSPFQLGETLVASSSTLTGTCNPQGVSKQRGSPAEGFGCRTLTVPVQGEDGLKKKSKAWLPLLSSPFLPHTPKHRARSPQKVAGWTARNPARWRDDI